MSQEHEKLPSDLSKYEQWVELTVHPPYPCYECYIEEDHAFCTRNHGSESEGKDANGNICNCQHCWPKTSYMSTDRCVHCHKTPMEHGPQVVDAKTFLMCPQPGESIYFDATQTQAPRENMDK